MGCVGSEEEDISSEKMSVKLAASFIFMDYILPRWSGAYLSLTRACLDGYIL
jgi:hypothetical protein